MTRAMPQRTSMAAHASPLYAGSCMYVFRSLGVRVQRIEAFMRQVQSQLHLVEYFVWQFCSQ